MDGEPNPRFTFSRTTAEALEFPSLLALIGERAASDLGRAALFAVVPCTTPEQFRTQRQRFQEAERLIAARPLVPLVEQPIAPLLAALTGGHLELGGRDLLQLGDLLRVGAEAKERVAAADPVCPALSVLTAPLPPCTELRRALTKTFDARGEIREDATPRLAELRSRIRGARQRAYQQLGTDVDQLREHLSEETIPLRNGRLVLVLQVGARGRVPGLIHGRSASGKSFFFEPLAAVELNNDLQQAIEEEAQEKRRILLELIAWLRRELPALESHIHCLTELDVLQAAVRFGQESGGVLADWGEPHEFKLCAARHPLLDPRLSSLREEALGQSGHSSAIIPLNLELTAKRRALVITGPNAGGKTVALKTVGLLALIHQCGFPIPAAAGSRLPFLDAVVATVGDDQDMLLDRSTFSGRLLRLREAWDLAAQGTLILLDELGSGTDPEEGAALAIALLEGLLARGCSMLVTTHLSQLAAAALEAEGAFCASMQFDSQTGEPTYQLLPGPPGGSEALALARRLGLPPAWLDRAETLLGSEHRDFRRLLAEVEQARRELAATQERLAQELADAELLRQRLAQRETELLVERKTVGERLKRELQDFRAETHKRLQSEVERLRAEVTAGRHKHVASATVERLFTAAPTLAPPSQDEHFVPLRIGGRVRHQSFGWEGELDHVDRGRAQVKVQGKVLSCREEDLLGLASGTPSAPLQPTRSGVTRSGATRSDATRSDATRSSATRSGATPNSADDELPYELNLIGQRVEAALELLDDFLDRALLTTHQKLRIIHGHGTGRLRTAVREHLRHHRAVSSCGPAPADEGGEGATLVRLKEI